MKNFTNYLDWWIAITKGIWLQMCNQNNTKKVVSLKYTIHLQLAFYFDNTRRILFKKKINLKGYEQHWMPRGRCWSNTIINIWWHVFCICMCALNYSSSKSIKSLIALNLYQMVDSNLGIPLLNSPCNHYWMAKINLPDFNTKDEV